MVLECITGYLIVMENQMKRKPGLSLDASGCTV